MSIKEGVYTKEYQISLRLTIVLLVDCDLTLSYNIGLAYYSNKIP